MKENIFKRVEQKYLLNKEEYEKMQELINNYFNKDIYYESKIKNIYFDNLQNDMLINSLEKPIFKKKIRLRNYDEDNKYYFEIKEKYKGVVYKRRVKIDKEEYYKYLNNGIIDNDNQITKEINYYLKYYNIHPYIYVAYDRLSYKSKDDENFRITFDNNLRYRLDNLDIDNDSNTSNYFNKDMYIMEVKCLDSLPYFFIKYLSNNKIYPKSFSKVGSIYTKEMESVLC